MDKQRTRTGSASRTTTAADEWLPLQRSQSIVTGRILRNGDIQVHSYRDWFMAFALALKKTDPTQSTLLAKTYLFLRDYMPEGFTGRFSHISGRDVMDYLLCHPGTTCTSRHKFAKSMKTALNDLEVWMGTHKSWQAALAYAKKEQADPKKISKRRYQGAKATALPPPAALIAVLIIRHPDPNTAYRNWIGRLQIGWMCTQSREALDVSSGFWKGLNGSNLYTVFGTDFEERKAETEMAADYERLLGRDFLASRKDIRPYLSSTWAGQLGPLREVPWDLEDDLSGQDEESDSGPAAIGDDPAPVDNDPVVIDSDPGSEDNDPAPEDNDPAPLGNDPAPVGNNPAVANDGSADDTDSDEERLPITKEMISRLGRHLRATRAPEPTVLEEWLITQLTSDRGSDAASKILSAWVNFWEDRIEGVQNFNDQMTVRSLFVHSLRRLYSMQTTSPLADPYMLLDMASWDMLEIQDVEKARSTLHRIPLFQNCSDSGREVIDLVEADRPSTTVRDAARRTFEQQVLYLCTFSQREPFFQFWSEVFALEILWTRVIIQGYKEPAIADHQVEFWKAKRGAIIRRQAELMLTEHQIRALLLPGADGQILTDWQDQLFRQEVAGLPRSSPAPVDHSTPYPSEIQSRHTRLYKLFGEVRRPGVATGSIPLNSPITPTLIPLGTHVPGPNAPASPPHSRPQSRLSQDVAAVEAVGSARKVTRYTGKFNAPKKRAASPQADERNPKSLRAGGLVTKADLADTLGDLKTELNAHSAQHQKVLDATVGRAEKTLRGELGTVAADLGQRIDSVKSELCDELGMERLSAQFDTLKSALHSAIDRDDTRQNLEKLTDTMSSIQTTMLDALRKQQDSINELARAVGKQRDEELAEHAQLAKQFADSATGLTNIQATLRQQQEEALGRLPAQQAARTPGQDGYLAQCTAPAMWDRDQAAYVAALLRGAWLYLHILDPDGLGDVGENEEVLGTVASTFPGLDEDHIIMAIDHLHMQVHGAPISQGGQD